MPARLVKGVRWYIEFYQTNPITKCKERVREYCQMNRIKDVLQRQQWAVKYINELNTKLLPYGYPFVEISQLPESITIYDGVMLSFNIKCRSDRKKTGITYGSVVNYFIKYIKERGRENTQLKDFSFRDAIMFMDHAQISKELGARTYNNYRQFMTAIWNELKDRGYISDNPWSRVKKIKETDKNRLMLSHDDAQIILNEIHRTHKMLFLSVLLLYYCFIRPEEQRRMKAHLIDLKNGTIYIPGDISKNKKSETVTIPSAIIPYLYDLGVDKIHRNDFIFGQYLKPHPTKQCGSNSLNEAHKHLITRLYQEKKLRSITGISIYSWKDTGGMSLVHSGVDIYQIMRQMRHSDLSTTQKYLKSLSHINEKIRDLKILLLPTSA